MNILKVEGMHCEGCVKRVTEGLKAEGIMAEVSLENKTVSTRLRFLLRVMKAV